MITIRRLADIALCAGVLGVSAAHSPDAQELSLPNGAELTRELTRDPGVYALPTNAWSPETGLPVARVEGTIRVQSWRVENADLTPFQLLSPLRGQLQDQGFETVFECSDRLCGGFDFRFATRVLPAPDMFVNLTDYMFLSARNDYGDAVSVLVSRDRNAGYVQIIRAGSAQGGTDTAAPALPVAVQVTPGTIAAALETQGHAILTDLEFETGSSSLGDGAVGSLDDIAAYLKANPARQVLFVGHTDAVGSLEGNQALSRRRAQSAVDYLRSRHDIPAARIGAQGVGFLSPIASNLSAEGREANRRVEAVLISTE